VRSGCLDKVSAEAVQMLSCHIEAYEEYVLLARQAIFVGAAFSPRYHKPYCYPNYR